MKNLSQQNNLIEIQTFHPYENTRNDMSSSRINLLKERKNDDSAAKKTELTVKMEYRALNAIINLKKVIIFVYICLAFDFSKNLYQSYLMTYTLMDILKIQILLIYLVRYFTSLINAIGLLKIIIVYKDYEDQKKNKKKNSNKKNAVYEENNTKSLDTDFELTVPLPIKSIGGVRFMRLIVWLINTLLFIIVVVINDSLNIHEYLDIFFNIMECFLLQFLRFYYSVLIRIEAYKEIYQLKDN